MNPMEADETLLAPSVHHPNALKTLGVDTAANEDTKSDRIIPNKKEKKRKEASPRWHRRWRGCRKFRSD